MKYGKNSKKLHGFRVGLLCMLIPVAILTIFVMLTAFQSDAKETASKRIVRVGYYIAPGFQDYDESSDTYSGSGYEYLMALRQYTNWEYEFVPVEFSDGVKMLQNGELDLMNNVSQTAEREQTLNFSTYASGSNYGCLIVDADNADYAYEDYESFNNMKIGLLAKSIYNDYLNDFCESHGIHPTVFHYDTDDQLVSAMKKGEIDARVVSSSYQDGSRVIAKFAPMDFYFATPKAQTDLLMELNDAMSAVQTDMPGLQGELEEKYAIKYVEDKVILSQSEKEYLAKHPTVKVAVNDTWYPISYFVEGDTYAGPLADIYHQIEKATGISFEFKRYHGYEAALQAVASGETDMIAECPYDLVFANEWNLNLTDLVNKIGMYCVVNENTYEGAILKIALYQDAYMNENVKKIYGDEITYINCDTVDEAIQAVLDGEADCTFMNQYLMSTYQNRGKYISLHYMQIPELEYSFCLGITADADFQLKTIVGKGLNTLNEDYYSSLFQMTAEMSGVPDLEAQFYQNPVLFIIICCSLIALIVLAIMFFFYRRRMNKKNKELQRAKQAQSDFLSRMSHDMRTPMNGILGLSYLMEKEKDVYQVREYISKLQESSHYLLQLINDALDVNKIESGNLILMPEVCDEQKVFDSILEMMHPLVQEKNLDFHFVKTNVEWQYMMLDEQRVKQIFVNLLSNAVKFTPAGGRIDFIMEMISQNEDVISNRFIVRDNGIGISKEFFPHVFEPFQQEHREDVGYTNGTGLGLSIVKQLVELMDGTISVKSEVNVGTEFTVYVNFPLAKEPYKKQKTAGKKEDGQQEQILEKGLHILLCEDHPLNAAIATKLLERQSAVVTWVEDGKKGVEAIEQSEIGAFDVILMDIRMPVMDGLEAAQRIRELEREDARKIPIIAMSANAYEEDIRRSIEAGMNAHLAKPIEPKEMYAAIEQYITGERRL